MSSSVRVKVERAETTFTVALAVMDCCSCGVIYGIPDEFDDRRRKDAKSFYCPNGHAQSYSESEADRLRKQLKQAEADREWYKSAEQDARLNLASTSASLKATKGVVTRMRKRAITGTCAFCHRHFANVERHVATKHPTEQP